MTDPNTPTPQGDLLGQARTEIAGMLQQGMGHPSTKPVLTGAAIGAVAGVVLPLVNLPLGLLAGAGFALYKRLRP